MRRRRPRIGSDAVGDPAFEPTAAGNRCVRPRASLRASGWPLVLAGRWLWRSVVMSGAINVRFGSGRPWLSRPRPPEDVPPGCGGELCGRRSRSPALRCFACRLLSGLNTDKTDAMSYWAGDWTRPEPRQNCGMRRPWSRAVNLAKHRSTGMSQPRIRSGTGAVAMRALVPTDRQRRSIHNDPHRIWTTPQTIAARCDRTLLRFPLLRCKSVVRRARRASAPDPSTSYSRRAGQTRR